MPMGSIPSNVKSARFMCGSNPHHINYNKLGDADRKAQALVPVCCFVNKAIIRKAGNKYYEFCRK